MGGRERWGEHKDEVGGCADLVLRYMVMWNFPWLWFCCSASENESCGTALPLPLSADKWACSHMLVVFALTEDHFQKVLGMVSCGQPWELCVRLLAMESLCLCSWTLCGDLSAYIKWCSGGSVHTRVCCGYVCLCGGDEGGCLCGCECECFLCVVDEFVCLAVWELSRWAWKVW